jgi:hypothetical protein
MAMLYVVQVVHKTLRARSDPLAATTALKVAKAWQSHGDRGVQIIEAGEGPGSDPASARSWSIRDFIAFLKNPAASRFATAAANDRPAEGAPR